MQIDEVPQDAGLNEGLKELTYAVDADGQYLQVPSLGWEPKNTTNDQAWEVINTEIAKAVSLYKAGKRSPLAYHMAANLMNVGLLASYMGLSRWRVRRHLKPKVFNGLKEELLNRYAQVFGISTPQLKAVPPQKELA
jgi:hypothetical protein